MGRYREENSVKCIDLRLSNLRQIYDSRDPSSFPDRDLDSDAVDYIVAAAEDLGEGSDCKLVTFVKDLDSTFDRVEVVADSIHRYFQYEVEIVERKRRLNFREAGFALVIGSFILLSALGLGNILRSEFSGLVSNLLAEGLMIVGWVALWRPFDLVIYSWWPQIKRRRLMRKLAVIPLELRQG